MANTIVLSKVFVDVLDQVYKRASLTWDLTADRGLIRQGNRANEIMIPKISMDGMADYGRNSGYTKGSVNLDWETVKFNYDRGRLFSVDYLDNVETADLAFGALAGEFMRTKVAPESDAFTFAQICSKTGISKVDTPATLANGEEFLKALIVAQTKMDEDEVPEENRILYCTPTLYNSVMALQTIDSREVLDTFAKIVRVPQSRFYTAIDLKTGDSGEEIGGYTKATAGKDINFMIIHRPAIIKWDKHVASDIITPEANQSADAYIQKYRKYGIVDVYENKVAGVYLHHKA